MALSHHGYQGQGSGHWEHPEPPGPEAYGSHISYDSLKVSEPWALLASVPTPPYVAFASFLPPLPRCLPPAPWGLRLDLLAHTCGLDPAFVSGGGVGGTQPKTKVSHPTDHPRLVDATSRCLDHFLHSCSSFSR